MIRVDGMSVFAHSAPTVEGEVLFLHSAPTSSDDWVDLLALTGGWAPDLPGFGRSDKGGNLDYSFTAYVDFAERLLDVLELDTVAVVGHGWGAAIGLGLAQRRPSRVSRMALIDAVTLPEGFRPPGIVRWTRRPLIGELLMGSVTRALLARWLRRGTIRPDAWPEEALDRVWRQFDQGTQRAILRLHRSVGEAGLAHARAGLEGLTMPILIAWGTQDPWLPVALADACAKQLGATRIERIAQAGHWPWLDRPELNARLAQWIIGRPSPPP
jgi:pimeloyl-ACP methyl ester carboxylesterase